MPDEWRYKWQAICDTVREVREHRDPVVGTEKFVDVMLKHIRSATKPAIDGGNGDEDKIVATQGVLELQWLRQGRPYYKVTEACYQALTRTSLDHCKLADIRLPFHSIELRFPEAAWGCFPVALLAVNRVVQDGQAGTPARVLHFLVQSQRVLDDPVDGIAVPLELVLGWRGDTPTFGGACRNAVDLSKRDSDAPDDPALSHLPEGKQHMHVAIGTALLATHSHDELFAPVLLRRDEGKWAAASPDQRAVMIERAHRLHKAKGWVLGHDLKCPTARQDDNAKHAPTGKQLTYQHWRCGHFHRIRHGKGHDQSKLLWFRPTLVRPDLPVAPNTRRSYRVAMPVGGDDTPAIAIGN